MNYDIFISYAHQGDNTSREAVAALVAQLQSELEADFRRRFNRDLEIFFDKTDIQSFHHWQVQCHRALQTSRFFIACLSRTYLRSDACRWEWEEWCKHEREHGLDGQAAASLWFVKLEDLDALEDAALLRRWKGDLLQRFHIQCHEWRHYDSGAFLDVAARSELQQLTEHVAQRLRLLTLDRARRGNLPWPNANFVGREPELASLRAALLDAPEPSLAGIHGVGGMGKTALVQAFAYKEADAFPGGCWLLRCEGRDRLLTVFHTLVTDLEIELTDEEKLDDARAVRRVFDLLRARGPALFLLDNVDRPALLAQEQMQLLADQPWARVLYTTRLAPDAFTKVGARIRTLDLDRLPENQAADLIRRYQPGQAFASPEHEAVAREIVRELSGLTLAVETAAVYLGQCDPRTAEPQYAVDAGDYLNKLREDLNIGGSEGVMSQLREVAATLRPTLARLDAPTLTVLQIASLLAPDGVALPWVRAIAGQRHPELATDAAAGESDPWTQLIRGLIGMRLFQPTAEPRVVVMHRILQRVLESELPQGRAQLHISLVPIVKEACATATYLHSNTDCRWLVSVIEATAVAWLDRVEHGESGLAPDAVFVSNCASGPLMDLAAWGRAEHLLRHALAVGKANSQVSQKLRHATQHNLASLLHYTNRLAEAEPLMREVVENFERYYDPQDPNGAAPLNNLATLLEITNRLPEAEELYRRALELDKKNLGSEHLIIAVRLNNLALLLRSTDRASEAEALLRQAIEIDERVLGTGHPTYARHLNNLATTLQEANRLQEAETLLIRAIAIMEQTLGNENPELASALNNLGMLLRDTHRRSEAEPLFCRALTILEKTLGMEHPKLGPPLTSLASLYKDTGRLPEAETLLRRALSIDEKSLGSSHPSVAYRLKNLGALLCFGPHPADAIPIMSRALQIDMGNLGAGNSGHKRLLYTLIKLNEDVGSPTEAAQYYPPLIALEEKSGAEQADLAALHNNYASLLKSLDQLSEAERHYRMALAILEKCLQPDDPKIATALNNLAVLLEAADCFEEARPLYHRMMVALARLVVRTGRQPASLSVALDNYHFLLQKCGLNEQQASEVVESACVEGGWPIRVKWDPNKNAEDNKNMNDEMPPEYALPPQVPATSKVESNNYWNGLENLCRGHVPKAIEELRSGNAPCMEYVAPRLSQLVSPPALRDLIQRARVHLPQLGTKFPRPIEVGTLEDWYVCVTVFPSEADADFLSRTPNGRVEDYLANCRKVIHLSSREMSHLNYAHWILLLNPAKGGASVHLYTQWSLVFIGQLASVIGESFAGAPFIAPVELLQEAPQEFLMKMMAIEIDAVRPK